MEPLENINNNDYNLEIGELSSQTPVGWSSICLDQTINYYIDCNTVKESGLPCSFEVKIEKENRQ